MILTGQQKATLKAAIIKAYQEEYLEILLLEKMELNYAAIAQGNSYINRVAFLIKYLENDGKICDLITFVKENKPNSPFFQELKQLSVSQTLGNGQLTHTLDTGIIELINSTLIDYKM